MFDTKAVCQTGSVLDEHFGWPAQEAVEEILATLRSVFSRSCQRHDEFEPSLILFAIGSASFATLAVIRHAKNQS
jgi:hypothetical protein